MSYKNYSYSNASRNNKKSNCQFVALDTNVFIDMSHHLRFMRDNRNCTNFIKRMLEIVRLAEQGKVKFVITPSVLGELTIKQKKLVGLEKEFLKKYCVILEPKDKVAYAQKVVNLSQEYIKNGVMDESATPFGDAKIMAEATIAGLNLLTNNYKDFEVYLDEKPNYYHDDKGDYLLNGVKGSDLPKDVSSFSREDLQRFLNLKGRRRSLDIGTINDKMKYSYINKNGYKVTPMPFTTIDYIGRRKNDEGLMNSNQFVNNLNGNVLSLDNTNERVL